MLKRKASRSPHEPAVEGPATHSSLKEKRALKVPMVLYNEDYLKPNEASQNLCYCCCKTFIRALSH
jgi:hypothetical protein